MTNLEKAKALYAQAYCIDADKVAQLYGQYENLDSLNISAADKACISEVTVGVVAIRILLDRGLLVDPEPVDSEVLCEIGPCQSCTTVAPLTLNVCDNCQELHAQHAQQVISEHVRSRTFKASERPVKLPFKVGPHFKLYAYYHCNTQFIVWEDATGYTAEIPGRNCPATVSHILSTHQEAFKWACATIEQNSYTAFATNYGKSGNACRCYAGQHCASCVDMVVREDMMQHDFENDDPHCVECGLSIPATTDPDWLCEECKEQRFDEAISNAPCKTCNAPISPREFVNSAGYCDACVMGKTPTAV